MKKKVCSLILIIVAISAFAESEYLPTLKQYRRLLGLDWAMIIVGSGVATSGIILSASGPDNMLGGVLLAGAGGGLAGGGFGLLMNHQPKIAKYEYLVDHPELSNKLQYQIENSKISLGMTEEQLIASWGRPRDINTTTGSFGVHKQYVYGDFGPYVYVEDGKVTGWQD